MMQKGNLAFATNIQNYMLENAIRESDVLARLRVETEALPDAIMQIPPDQGQLMALLVKLVGAKRTLEIGVYTGYSTLCVAKALPDDGYTLACDINERSTDIAKKYWAEASVDHKIDLRIGPAADTLKTVIKDGQCDSYDFIFIDADKENVDLYYELSLQLLRVGGLIAIDNVLLMGLVLDLNNLSDGQSAPVFSEVDIVSMRNLNIKIKNDDRVDTSMLALADGLTLARKR